mmetsp:Transcript_39032/g.103712  ORF Transcript_39032/g.103712 Transcript_39032/m.103712 type:complete len:97 (-) Transcript_39032:131-421(-)
MFPCVEPAYMLFFKAPPFCRQSGSRLLKFVERSTERVAADRQCMMCTERLSAIRLSFGDRFGLGSPRMLDFKTVDVVSELCAGVSVFFPPCHIALF